MGKGDLSLAFGVTKSRPLPHAASHSHLAFSLLLRPNLSDSQDRRDLGRILPGPLISLCRRVLCSHLEVETSPCAPTTPQPIPGCPCLSCSHRPGTAILVSQPGLQFVTRLCGQGPFSSAFCHCVLQAGLPPRPPGPACMSTKG